MSPPEVARDPSYPVKRTEVLVRVDIDHDPGMPLVALRDALLDVLPGTVLLHGRPVFRHDDTLGRRVRVVIDSAVIEEVWVDG
jgi:hypothetical protein